MDKIANKNRNINFPYTVTRSSGLYILPTRAGLLFITVLIVMLAGSINYGNNLGFLFTFLLASMAFISLLHTHRNLLGLTLRSASFRSVFAGDRMDMQLFLQGEGRERPGLCFDVNVDGEHLPVCAPASGTVAVPVPTADRGNHRVMSMTVSSSYPFGLFRTWTTLYPDLTYLVYPGSAGGEFTPSNDMDGADNPGAKEQDGVDDFKGLRPYRPGDPMGRLSWKTFAQGKGLYTKEFSAHMGEAVMITWDDIRSGQTEWKISRLCDMVLKAHDMNLSYGLSIPGVLIERGEPKDKAHRHRCLKALALYGKGSDVAGRKRP